MCDMSNNVNTTSFVLRVKQSDLDRLVHCLTDSAKLLAQFSLFSFVVHRESAQGVQRDRHECMHHQHQQGLRSYTEVCASTWMGLTSTLPRLENSYGQ